MNLCKISLLLAVALPFSGALPLSGAFAQTAPSNAPLQLQPLTPPAGKSGKTTPPVANPGMSAREIVTKANAYFNAQTNYSAEFVQLTTDGHRSEGELYVSKPGKMFFDYTKPAVLQIIADGTSVAVRDKKLNTQDMYFISQTPLKFLLSNTLDLAKDTKVLDVKSDADNVAILIEDKATLGGTSRIKLIFDPGTFELKQWIVTDPQGYETVVSLFNIDNKARPDPELFHINTATSTPTGKH